MAATSTVLHMPNAKIKQIELIKRAAAPVPGPTAPTYQDLWARTDDKLMLDASEFTAIGLGLNTTGTFVRGWSSSGSNDVKGVALRQDIYIGGLLRPATTNAGYLVSKPSTAFTVGGTSLALFNGSSGATGLVDPKYDAGGTELMFGCSNSTGAPITLSVSLMKTNLSSSGTEFTSINKVTTGGVFTMLQSGGTVEGTASYYQLLETQVELAGDEAIVVECASAEIALMGPMVLICRVVDS